MGEVVVKQADLGLHPGLLSHLCLLVSSSVYLQVLVHLTSDFRGKLDLGLSHPFCGGYTPCLKCLPLIYYMEGWAVCLPGLLVHSITCT